MHIKCERSRIFIHFIIHIMYYSRIYTIKKSNYLLVMYFSNTLVPADSFAGASHDVAPVLRLPLVIIIFV